LIGENSTPVSTCLGLGASGSAMSTIETGDGFTDAVSCTLASLGSFKWGKEQIDMREQPPVGLA